jgi:hypothetical protein
MTMYQLRALSPSFIEITSKTWPNKTNLQKLYRNIAPILQNIWLEQIQKNIHAEEKFPSSLFDAEQQKLESLFDSTSNPDKIKVLQLCNLLRVNAQVTLTEKKDVRSIGSVDIFKEQIGLLIYLCDQNLQDTASKIDLDDVFTSLSSIKAAFISEIKLICEQLEKKRELHKKTGLQDPLTVLSIQKPLEIAKILVTSHGILNSGLIDLLIKHFFDSKKVFMQHEKEFIQTLFEIKNSASLQEQIQKIKAPNSPFFLSNELIAITLNLPPDTIPTDREAKIVALAALLSSMRQGEAGRCFISSLPPLMKPMLKKRILADFQQILYEGKLTKMQSNQKIKADIIFHLEDEALYTPFFVDIECQIASKTAYLWESPGLIAACQQIGIEKNFIKHAIKKNINTLYELEQISLSEQIEITPEILINQIAETVAHERHLSSQQTKDLLWLALLAFSSETSVCLYSVWESCLEVMSGITEKQHLHKRILKSIKSSLADQWPTFFFNSVKQRVVKKMRKIFNRMVEASIYSCYKEQTSFKNKGEILGAFILLELSKGKRITVAKKIESPNQFKQFVLHRLKAAQEIISLINPLPECQLYQEIIEKIQSHVSKSDIDFYSFLNSIFRDYEKGNKNINNPLKEWQQIPYLPFREIIYSDNALFNNPNGVAVGTSESMRPKNGLELLESFIHYSRELLKEKTGQTISYNNAPPSDLEYLFKLTPNHPTAIEPIHSSQPAREWIEEHLIKPGLATANLQLTDKMKNSYIQSVSQKLLPLELIHIFQNKAVSIDSRINTVQQFSQQLLKILLELSLNLNEVRQNEISTALSNILLEKVLPEESVSFLTQTAVRIAETGGESQEIRTLSFVCCFDPITKKIQLGTVDENLNRLRILNPVEWVAYMPWEMHGIKLHPLLVDHKIELL